MKLNPLHFLIFISLIAGSCNPKKDFGLASHQNAYPDNSAYFKKTAGDQLFQPLSPQKSGIRFANHFRESLEQNYWKFIYSVSGGGVAIGDLNQDGLPDLYFCGTQVPDRLYLNEGNLKFRDVSEQAGISKINGWSTGVTMADVNGDGLPDIYVCRGGPVDETERKNRLFINQGGMHFAEEAEAFGLDDPSYSTHAAFLDFDRDGDLDMYCLNHPTDFNDIMKLTAFDKVEKGINQSDHFYRNNGDGTFSDISIAAGINNHGYGLSLSIGDFNNDGWPDVYVANDFAMIDLLYLNQQDGTFKESFKDSFGKTGFFAMGTDFDDINNDALPDLALVAINKTRNEKVQTFTAGTNHYKFDAMVKSGFHYQYRRNTLQLNNGNGTFSEIAELAGIAATDWSWSPLFADFDNDGWKDLFVSNGYYIEQSADYHSYWKQARQAIRQKDPEAFQTLREEMSAKGIGAQEVYPNYVFRNNGDLSFSDMQSSWGMDIPTQSYGAAYSDLDNDGDVDLVVNNLNQEALIYENRANLLFPDRHFLEVALEGDAPNTFGMGSQLLLTFDDGSLQWRHLSPGKGFASSSDPVLHFGLGKHKVVETLWITWPDGKTQKMAAVAADQLISIKKDPASFAPLPEPIRQSQLFKDATSAISPAFVHRENDFVDFESQFLIHNKLSSQGPAISVADVNGDGLEDFFAGGSAGQSGQLYLQKPDGRFLPHKTQAWEQEKESEDVVSIFFDADQDGDNDLYVGRGGSEFLAEARELQDGLYLNDGKGSFALRVDALPQMFTSTGCISAYDFDGDGDQDLFVGGRQVPLSYPTSPGSFLLRNDKGKFMDVTQSLCPDLERPGMITAAVWEDLDGDGLKDLALAGEWMKIRIFRNTGTGFQEIPKPAGLGDISGWWSALIATDIDSDGDLDLIAGNTGLNTRYRTSKEEPVEIFYADFDQNGIGEGIMTYFNYGERYPTQAYNRIQEQIPGIKKKLPSYSAFGKSTVEEIFGQKELENALHLQATNFGSGIFMNDGQAAFRFIPFPNEAQFSPIFGLLSTDLNSDGLPDIIFQGNFWGTEPRTWRQDASNGGILMGDGKGGFKVIRNGKSGFYSPKDARGLAWIHLGKEKRPAILAAVNNDTLKLFEGRVNGPPSMVNSR